MAVKSFVKLKVAQVTQLWYNWPNDKIRVLLFKGLN